MGKPVLGARLGSMQEQVVEGKTGLLFEPGDIDELADKMDYLINHKSMCIDMGKRARRLVEDKHSPHIHYDLLMRVYEKVMRK